jgi:hypothetical protein
MARAPDVAVSISGLLGSDARISLHLDAVRVIIKQEDSMLSLHYHQAGDTSWFLAREFRGMEVAPAFPIGASAPRVSTRNKRCSSCSKPFFVGANPRKVSQNQAGPPRHCHKRSRASTTHLSRRAGRILSG